MAATMSLSFRFSRRYSRSMAGLRMSHFWSYGTPVSESGSICMSSESMEGGSVTTSMAARCVVGQVGNEGLRRMWEFEMRPVNEMMSSDLGKIPFLEAVAGIHRYTDLPLHHSPTTNGRQETQKQTGQWSRRGSPDLMSLHSIETLNAPRAGLWLDLTTLMPTYLPIVGPVRLVSRWC